MAVRSAIVVTIDGLGAALLGPYGNAWVSTPGLDQLAAESLVVEHALSDSHQLETVFRSYWQGRHAACQVQDQASLAALCRQQHIQPILISDDPTLMAQPAARDFHQHFLKIVEPKGAATDAERTVMAQFFDAAAQFLDAGSFRRKESPLLLWVHARGFSRAWDCPSDFRMSLVDESDPEPPAFVEPPRRNDQPLDPDELWSLRVAYAAQLNLLDACLHVYLEKLHRMFQHHDLLTVVTSPRGYPLGEHRAVGNEKAVMQGEQLHVPMMLRGPVAGLQPQRTQIICQPPAVFGTINEWLSLDADRATTGALAITQDSDSSESIWHRAITIDGVGALSGIRTPGWFLRSDEQTPEQQRVYAKPDDRWEINEIGDRVPDLAGALRAELVQFMKMAKAEQLDQLGPLPEALRCESRST